MPTKTQQYASALYTAMLEEAEKRDIDRGTVTVWSGSLTAKCKELGIPKGTERRAVRPLEDMGCIQILQRGVSSWPSVVVLLRPPTDDLWSDFDSGLTSRPTLAKIALEVRDIQERLGGVDLGEILTNFEERIKRLERS